MVGVSVVIKKITNTPLGKYKSEMAYFPKDYRAIEFFDKIKEVKIKDIVNLYETCHSIYDKINEFNDDNKWLEYLNKELPKSEKFKVGFETSYNLTVKEEKTKLENRMEQLYESICDWSLDNDEMISVDIV